MNPAKEYKGLFPKNKSSFLNSVKSQQWLSNAESKSCRDSLYSNGLVDFYEWPNENDLTKFQWVNFFRVLHTYFCVGNIDLSKK